MTDEREVTGAEVLAAVGKATTLPAFIEHTGGGVATVYVGYPGPDSRYTLAIGPGSLKSDPRGDGGHSATFSLDDLYVGEDDDGEGEVWTITDLGSLTDKVREVLLGIDERFSLTFPATVEDIRPGTPEWDESERALERQRRAGL